MSRLSSEKIAKYKATWETHHLAHSAVGQLFETIEALEQELASIRDERDEADEQLHKYRTSNHPERE